MISSRYVRMGFRGVFKSSACVFGVVIKTTCNKTMTWNIYFSVEIFFFLSPRSFLVSPIFGRVRPGGSGNWIPTSCSGRNCWSNSRSSGGRRIHPGGCKIVWKHKSKANVWNMKKREKETTRCVCGAFTKAKRERERERFIPPLSNSMRARAF